MTRLATVGWGPDQFRVGPWHGDPRIAYVTVTSRREQPSADAVRRLVERLRADGFEGVMTAALRAGEIAPFLHLGFAERERLVVLSHDLRMIPDPGAVPCRRARRGDRAAVLEVDHLAFDRNWQLDGNGLRDALDATPRSRFRVVDRPGRPGEVVAYAVCGRAGRAGYIQRLAVQPSLQRRGIGRALVVDAIAWLRRRGAQLALVNTQQANRAALDLYRRLGFQTEPNQLCVLVHDLA